MKDETLKQINEIFNAVQNEGNKWQITTGNYIISRMEFETYEEAEKYINKKPYDIIMNLCALIATNVYKLEKETNNNNKNK